MKFGKIMLITFLLWAVLTIGAVSADDDIDFNETLTVDNIEEVSLDASFEGISNDCDSVLASSAEDVISDGNEIIKDSIHPYVWGPVCTDADWNPDVAGVFVDNDVQEGDINLTIFRDGMIFTDLKTIDYENYQCYWSLEELRGKGILNELGTYTFNFKYVNGTNEVDLGEYPLLITQLNYNFMQDELYRGYPFEVIKVYGENINVGVYIKGRDEPYTIRNVNTVGLTLENLSITSFGDYDVTVVSYDNDENIVDNFTFTLNIVDSVDWYRLYAPFEVGAGDLNNKVLYLLSPEGMQGNLSLSVAEGITKEFKITDTWIGWTLDDLNITENGPYNVQLFNGTEYICDAWINVNGIITQDNFNPWIASFESIENENSWIVNIHAHDGLDEGDVIVTIVNSDGVNRTFVKNFQIDADDCNDVIWVLEELDEILNAPGRYTINVTYDNGVTQVDLFNDFTFNLVRYEYNIYAGNIFIESPFDVIIVRSEGIDVKVYVNGNPVNDDEGSLRWTLSDLNITEVGEYAITIEAYEDSVLKEEFTYNLNVDNDTSQFRLICNEFGVQEWEVDDSVLYLISPSEKVGETVTFSINDDESDLDITDTRMSWTLDDLGIYENGNYDIKILDGDEELAQTNLFIDCLEEKVRVNFWDDGKLYDDCTDVVISVEIPEDKRGGAIIVLVGDREAINWEINGNGYNEWTLEDLEITEAGDYEITVKYVAYDGENIDYEEIIDEGVLNVVKFNYDEFRVILDKDSEIIKIYCPNDKMGTISINVVRSKGEEEPEEVSEVNHTIESDDWGSWIEFSLNSLRFMHDGNEYEFDISVPDDEAGHFSLRYSVDNVDSDVWDDENVLYLDCTSPVIRIDIPKGNTGRLEVYVNGTNLYSFKVKADKEYLWNLQTLNITEPGDYNVLVKFIDKYGIKELCNENLTVVEFANDTVRVKKEFNPEDDEGYCLYLFAPENSDVALIISLIYDYGDSEVVDEFEVNINSTYYDKWIDIEEIVGSIDLKSRYSVVFSEGLDEEDEKIYNVMVYHINDDTEPICTFQMEYVENVDQDELEESVLNKRFFLECNQVNYNGERVNIEESLVEYRNYPGLSINHHNTDDSFFDSKKEIAYVFVPYDKFGENISVKIIAGSFEYSLNFNGSSEYVWQDYNYIYVITLDDVYNFTQVEDKTQINFIITKYDGSENTFMCFLKKDNLKLYMFNEYDLGVDFKIVMSGEEDDDENIPVTFNDTKIGDLFAEVTIGDKFNVTDGKIVMVSGDKIILSKNLSELEKAYEYSSGGYIYSLLFKGFDLEGLNDKDLINFTIVSSGNVIKSDTLIYRIVDEENVQFFELHSQITFDIHYEKLANPSHGIAGSITDGSFMVLEIPEYLGITEGEIVIVRDDTGEVLFNKSLSSFDNSDSIYTVDFVEDHQSWEYIINADESIYGKFPENVNMTFSFNYANNSISRKSVRIGDSLYKINTPYDISLLFNITVEQNVICDDGGIAISIIAVDANRHSINIDLGGGYFEVYVNDVKVEDLGRLNRWESETELELFRLTGRDNGNPELYIALDDLNITENGVYNIKVVHHSAGGDNHLANEVTLLWDQNVTLTSNVKVENATSGVLTGFGMDPVLLYLDVYYGLIDDVTGNIAVSNSKGEEILKADILSLSKDDEGRYYLKYSDFKNKDFGDRITVDYSGNERSGTTFIDVLWRDVNATDFAPVVDDDVNDYYGDFINLQIPDSVSAGQVIVTLKFKGNHSTNLPNMNVISDFGSQAVYTFDIADIKANYADGFKLSLSDLGFYEDDGNYDVDVKFAAGGEVLNVTNNTFNVAFSSDILININETARYTFQQAFASVRIFEPTNAYADLYIDGKLFAHKTSFEDGRIIFDSSNSWAPGIHTAEIRVIQSEFERLLNSSSTTFEVLTQTNDVDVSVADNIKENEHVIVDITVPKEGNVSIDGVRYELHAGLNHIDLGQLAYGNHTMWVLYEAKLDDGNMSFYNNYVSVFVGDDGHWLDLPDPLVLNDDDTIKMNFGEGATGYVLIYIDNKLIANRTLVNGAAEYVITDEIFNEDYVPDLLADSSETKYGKHTYKVVYSGDATHDSLVRQGEFYVEYIFKDDIPLENPLKEIYDVTVTLPDDATGTVRITVNNKQYTANVKDGQAVVKLDNLGMGEHKLNVEYLNDDKYPYASYDAVLNVTYYAVTGDFANGNRIISLLLEKNATGNLTVYNDNMRTQLYSIPLQDGKASIDLSNMGVGIYDIRAYYDGDDYYVRTFTTSFKVMPEVIIAQGITIGETGRIFIDLDNATGYMIVFIEGAKPDVVDLVNGTLNYTYATDNLVKGNHTVTFEYSGDSFDRNIFYKEIGSNVRKEYNVEILPIKVLPKTVSDEDEVYLINIYDEDGNFLSDAGGQVAVTVLDLLTGESKKYVIDVVNGIATLPLSALKDGDYSLSWDYLGDDKYGSFSRETLLSVKHKRASIVANDLSMLYTAGSKYSVTVYTKDGKPANGVSVSFLVNGKPYGDAITNANGVAGILIDNAPGSYRITSSALGESVTKQLTVGKILSLKIAKVKSSAKKLVLTATLKKVNGKYLKGKKITFKFKGKKYTAKTNKKGVAKVTIKKNVLKKLKKGKKVIYQATYLKDTVKKIAKVKK